MAVWSQSARSVEKHNEKHSMPRWWLTGLPWNMTGDVSDLFLLVSLMEEHSVFHPANSSSGAVPFDTHEGHEQSHVKEIASPHW